ncbi:MAG: TerC family protein [Caldisphaera sp.]|jgi:tellurite resistance protein TerC|nr:hypothetical protein [Caldisphaera sp.]
MVLISLEFFLILFILLIIGVSLEFFIKNNRFKLFLWLLLAFFFFSIISIFNFNDGFIFISAYLLEISLSLDNIMIFLLIFKEFEISNQEKALIIGSYSAVLLRFLFVYVGITILNSLEVGSLILSSLVIFSAVYLGKNEINKIRNKKEKEKNTLLQSITKILKINYSQNEDRLFIKKDRKTIPTKLLIAIIAIEIADIIFATDSVPAIILLTKSEILAYSSTIFGTMIIRSIYFNINKSLSNIPHIEGFLSIGLGYLGVASILSFLYKYTKGYYGFHIPNFVDALVTILIITIGMLFSYLRSDK